MGFVWIKRENKVIFVGRYKELNPSYNFPSMVESFEKSPYEGKDRVIQYLKNGIEDMVSLSAPTDVISGAPIHMTMKGMNDGEYTWFNTLAYYVDKYNLRLPKEFEDKILKG